MKLLIGIMAIALVAVFLVSNPTLTQLTLEQGKQIGELQSELNTCDHDLLFQKLNATKSLNSKVAMKKCYTEFIKADLNPVNYQRFMRCMERT
jgi:hypothetical protein